MMIRDFLSTGDVLEMRTTGHKLNIARLYGPEAEMLFFLLAKDDRDNPASRPEWSELQSGYKQLFSLVRDSNSLTQVRDSKIFGTLSLHL